MQQIGELIPRFSEPEIVPDLTFDRFWSEYPRKTGDKKKAQDKFEALTPEDRRAAIEGAIRHRDGNPQWQDQALIPHPMTFINQRRWENEFTSRPQDEAITNGHKSPVDAVWSAMSQMFGKAWIDKHGIKPSPVWHSQIKGMNMQQIQRGLRQTRDQGLEHPPSLPYFVSLCKTSVDHLPEARMLPKAPSDPEKAEEAFAEMKKILGIAN